MVHGGILYKRDNSKHQKEAQELNIQADRFGYGVKSIPLLRRLLGGGTRLISEGGFIGKYSDYWVGFLTNGFRFPSGEKTLSQGIGSLNLGSPRNSSIGILPHF